MTEHVLPYDPVIAPQERYWDCGPASTQIVLNSRGIIESETSLIADIGTTVNGTDDVSWVEHSMDRRLPEANYTTVYVSAATDDAREALWRNIVQSINAGYGLVVNIDVPPGNYPRGVKGSPNPAYGGGEVFHYIAAMGYDDDPAFRCVWIADPGFRPFGYWVALDQLVTMIVPKGYTYANTGAAQPITELIEGVPMTISNQQKLDEIHDKLTAYPDVPEIGGKWPSRARCRSSNAGVDDTVGMVLYEDANLYDLLTAWSAVTVGDPNAIKIIDNGAAGRLPANDPDSITWFKAVQSKIVRK